MKILITGACGFVGTNLVSALSSHSTLHIDALDLLKKENSSFVKYYNWNQLDEIDINSIFAIIHLAGKAHDTQNTLSEDDYNDVNVKLTINIFEYFLKSKAKKFIFFSSVKAAADTISEGILTEEYKPNPQTPYGKSKREAEKYILSHQVLSEKNIYILRPCMIHGKGNKGNLNLLYDIVKKGIPWPLGAFKNKRSFTSIENVVYIIKQIIDKDIESGIYNISDDDPMSTNDLIKLIAESQKRKPHIFNISPYLIKFVSSIGSLLHLPLNNETLKKLTESYVVSNEKIKNELKIEKMPISTKDGFVKTLESFK